MPKVSTLQAKPKILSDNGGELIFYLFQSCSTILCPIIGARYPLNGWFPNKRSACGSMNLGIQKLSRHFYTWFLQRGQLATKMAAQAGGFCRKLRCELVTASRPQLWKLHGGQERSSNHIVGASLPFQLLQFSSSFGISVAGRKIPSNANAGTPLN